MKRFTFAAVLITLITCFACREACCMEDKTSAQQTDKTAPEFFKDGMSYAQKGMTEKAKETFDKAIKLEPGLCRARCIICSAWPILKKIC